MYACMYFIVCRQYHDLIYSLPQYWEYKDSDIKEVFQIGQQYLMSKEMALGSQGRFLDRSTQECGNDEFSDYHASYCAAVGLLEPHYVTTVKDYT